MASSTEGLPTKQPSVVAVATDADADRFTLLETVLAQSKLFEVLERNRRASGKSKADFFVVVKPNISMMLRRADIGTYTDTFLVIHLLRLLLAKGYTRLAVVESQNLYGSWFDSRSVVQVGARAGYYDESVLASYSGQRSHDIHVRGGGVDGQVPLVDLSVDVADWDGPEGRIKVGKTWSDADFRISFAGMKTHFYSYYTLAIKNVYGCLPLQDKVRGYHCPGKVPSWTAMLIKHFPVHFSIVDGYSAADGWMGVKMKAIFTKAHTFLAGEDIQAVDHVGAQLMGLEPEKSVMYRELLAHQPLRPYRVVGDARPIAGWRNPPDLLPLFSRFLEMDATLMDFGGAIATGGNDECFGAKENTAGPFKRALYWLSMPVAFACDFGIVELRRRQRYFTRKLKSRRTAIPMLSASDYLRSGLTFLSHADLTQLIGLIKGDLSGPFRLSGHYLFADEQEYLVDSRVSVATLVAAEMLNHLWDTKGDFDQFAAELAVLQRELPELFDPAEPYAYCYR